MAMPSNWKQVLLRSIGAGVGFALTLSAIASVFIWYSNGPKHEKPWNQTAIKVSATGTEFSVQDDRLVGDFRYSLQNTTDRDYRLPSDSKLMERLAQDMSYRDVPNMTWVQNLYIPSGQTVNVSILLPIMYSDFDFSRQNDEKWLSAFIDRRLAEIDGFALFDPTNRYKVDFPNGWPDAVARVRKRDADIAAKYGGTPVGDVPGSTAQTPKPPVPPTRSVAPH
jgi:hypothetical protein